MKCYSLSLFLVALLLSCSRCGGGTQESPDTSTVYMRAVPVKETVCREAMGVKVCGDDADVVRGTTFEKKQEDEAQR